MPIWLPWKRGSPRAIGPCVRITGPGGERSVALPDAMLTIGRATDNDLVLSGRSVTSRHARLVHNGDAFNVEDAGSNTGTYVNGVRINGAFPVNAGDEIRIGAYTLRLER